MPQRWCGLPEPRWMGVAVERWGNRLDAGMGVEKLAMFFKGKSIGHTRDIIADDSGRPFRGNARREAWRHLSRGLSIRLEEIMNDAACLLSHADHPVVAIEMLQQKKLELRVLVLHRLAESH